MLLNCVGLVGKWLLRGGSAPLTRKERCSMIWRLNSFDRLPEVPATALVSLSQKLLLKFYDSSSDNTWLGCSFGRPETVGLLSADQGLRARFFQASATIGDNQARTALNVLNQILYMDWEILGGRYWVPAAIDLMLGCSTTSAKHSKLLSAVRTLCHVSTSASEEIFKFLLKNMWEQLPNDSCRRLLIPGVETLLARPYHRQLLNTVRERSERALRKTRNSRWISRNGCRLPN